MDFTLYIYFNNHVRNISLIVRKFSLIAGRISLIVGNVSDLGSRLMPNELEELKGNVELLKNEKLPIQQEKLSDLKSKTKSQDEVGSALHTCVMDVRNIVKAANAPANIQKSFGVGEILSKSVAGTIAAAKIIMQGYRCYMYVSGCSQYFGLWCDVPPCPFQPRLNM